MNTQTKLTKFYKDPISLLLFFALATIIFIHLFTTLSIGYISDDYSLINNAKYGTNLWSLHYSPMFRFLWECSASGSLSALDWHLLTFGFHIINTLIIFLIAQKCFHLSLRMALFSAVLTSLNPAGIEALAWSCSAGYVLTAALIYFSIYFLFSRHEVVSFNQNVLTGFTLAIIQLAAFLTWDWGILIFPVLLVCSLIIDKPYAFCWKDSVLRLGPICLCWVIGAYLRATSDYSYSWQHNSWDTMLKFALGSPMLGLFPNFDKTFYSSAWGILSGSLLLVFLIWTALKSRIALALLVCYFLSILPWVLGGNPSGRYFYIPMSFIYLILAIGLQKIPYKTLSAFGIVFLISCELYLAYTRASLWKQAYVESQNLKFQVETIALEAAVNPIIIVNMPDSYGPNDLAMRPQMWFCGLNALYPNIKIVKTSDCNYIWKPTAAYHDRNSIVSKYNQNELYEVVYQTTDNWKSFALVPLEKTE